MIYGLKERVTTYLKSIYASVHMKHIFSRTLNQTKIVLNFLLLPAYIRECKWLAPGDTDNRDSRFPYLLNLSQGCLSALEENTQSCWPCFQGSQWSGHLQSRPLSASQLKSLFFHGAFSPLLLKFPLLLALIVYDNFLQQLSQSR